MAVPNIPNIEALIQAGINPKTMLPYKLDCADAGALKPNIRKCLRIVDEQDFLTRYKWSNLPRGLTEDLIERILYYKGQGALFYVKEIDKFYFLPFTLSSANGNGIDVYGRYIDISPLPFTGTVDNEKKPKAFLGLTLSAVYDCIPIEDLKEKDVEMSAVILSDYSRQISQTVLSRQILNDPIIDLESDLLPFMRTALLNSTGIQGEVVSSEDEALNVKAASAAINKAALVGEKYIPIRGDVTLRDMTSGQVAKAEEFLLAMQSIDNLRLSMLGLENGGLFQKKAHELQSEQSLNQGTYGAVLQDGLNNRQRFCDIVNSIWGLMIWCEPSEISTGNDQNLDGLVSDQNDMSGTRNDGQGGGQDDTTI